MTQLPEPDGALFPKTDKPLQPCAPLGGYAPDTVRQLIAQARADALEEAMKACEESKFQEMEDDSCAPFNNGCKVCAISIRALKEKQ